MIDCWNCFKNRRKKTDLNLIIKRTFDKRFVLQNVSVNLRGFDVLMSEKFQHGANVVLIFQKMRRKTVAEGVAISVFGNFGLLPAHVNAAVRLLRGKTELEE